MKRSSIIACILSCILLVSAAGCSQAAGASAAPSETAASNNSLAEEQPAEASDEQAADSGQPDRTSGSSVVDAIMATYSTKEFAEGEVDGSDLTAILEAGLKAPSARNSQPWHLSVVGNTETIGQYVQAAQAGSVLIIVSGMTEEIEGVDVSFDCGLTTANLYLAAQSLGYGAHIYAAPVSSMNQDKESLGIPEDYAAVAAVLIGPSGEGADAVSGATARNPLEESVTYVE